METIEVICKACGQTVTLDKPDTGDQRLDRMLMNIAQGVIHGSCWNNFYEARKNEATALRLHQRSEQWGRLCDPFYQSSEAWLATTPGLKVNGKKITEARAWSYSQKGLLLYGLKSGSGKTTAAWLVLKKEHGDGRMIVAMSHGEFARQATLLLRNNEKEQIAWAKTVSECDILFIDDLGKSKFQTLDGSGKAAEEFLFDVIDSRMKHLRPCIFTTNNNSNTLQAKLSQDRAEPFMRRLRETSIAINFDVYK